MSVGVAPHPAAEPEVSFQPPEGAGQPNYTVTPKISGNGVLDGEMLEV